MNAERFDALMIRLDEMPKLIRRSQVRAFWLGWLSGTIGSYLLWWL